MALGSNHTTKTSAATFVPEVWSDEVIASFKSNLVLANLVKNMNHAGKKGDTIHIPAPIRGDASQKTAENQVNLISNTEGEVLVSIDKHFEYSRLIEDIVETQALNSLRQFYTDDAGFALAKRADTDLGNLFGGFQGGTNYSGAIVGSDGVTGWDPSANSNTGNGSALTDAGIRKMIQTLDDEDVPMSQRYLVIPPVEKANLLGIDRFTEQAFVGEVGGANSIRNGRVGNVYGVEVYVSSNVPTITADDSSTNYRAASMFHESAMVLITQVSPRTQTQYKQEYLGDLLTVDMLYGVNELRDNAAVVAAVPS
mgnify:CR=1 FL=1